MALCKFWRPGGPRDGEGEDEETGNDKGGIWYLSGVKTSVKGGWGGQNY